MSYDKELRAAIGAARQAGDIILECYNRFRAIPDAPASIHTEADSQSQEVILRHLRQNFPDDAFCAEELSAGGVAIAGTGPRLWIIDPIDGTRGFARKNGEFSVMVAFVHEGQPAVGIVLEPARDRLTCAVRGGGCWRRDGRDGTELRCRVSEEADPGKAMLVQSHSKDPGKRSGRVQALAPARVIESYSAGIKLALVARGEVELYLNTYQEFHDWDICAGHILVSEAGGRVTGLAGEEIRYGLPGAWQRSGLLATNGRLHDQALQKLATALD